MKPDKQPTTRHLFVGGPRHGTVHDVRRLPAAPGVDPHDPATLPSLWNDLESGVPYAVGVATFNLPDPITGKPAAQRELHVYVDQRMPAEHKDAAVNDACAQAFIREHGSPLKAVDAQDNGHAKRDWHHTTCRDCKGMVLPWPTELAAKAWAAEHVEAMGHYVEVTGPADVPPEKERTTE